MHKVYQQVAEEEVKQNAKWGEQNHPCLDQTLLNRPGGCTPKRMCEEFELPTEERARQLYENAFRNGKVTYAHILLEEFTEAISEFDTLKRREELIQVAAVAISWIKKIDRDLKIPLTEAENNQVTINAEFLFELHSKQQWINRLPDILPEKTRPGEHLIWIDKDGDVFETGLDFSVAEEIGTYPCKVYRPIVVSKRKA